MTPGRTLLVVNPVASQIRAEGERDGLVAAIARAPWLAGSACEVLVERDPTRIREAVLQALAAGTDRVIAAGGDGTVMLVASTVARSAATLVIVPVGTANILARILGIGGSARHAIEALRDSRTREIDLGRARWGDGSVGGMAYPGGTRFFAVGCGIGFDARVMAATSPDQKRRLGRLSYFATALGSLGAVAPGTYRIDLDGRHLEIEAAIALVLNAGELVPGLVRPRLPVLPDDGLLDLLVVRANGPVEGLRGVLAALRTSAPTDTPRGRAWRARVAAVTIETVPPEPVEIDGDVVGSGRLSAAVAPRALRVLVPAGG